MDLNSHPSKSAHNPCRLCKIRQHSIFQGIPKESIVWTQDFLESQRKASTGQLIYREGEKLTSLFTIFDGWVSLFKELPTGKRQILRIALPGDFIGYQTDGHHLAEALTNTRLCSYPYAKLSLLFSSYPEISKKLTEFAIRDMNLCQQHLATTGRATALERVASLLSELFERSLQSLGHTDRCNLPSIQFPLTQELIGDTVGLTSVHVNRVLRELGQQEIIHCHKRKLTIKNLERLHEIAHFDASSIAPPSMF
jgi:CRP/FNR family transcriptional regulator, anaerobic regulatory protein